MDYNNEASMSPTNGYLSSTKRDRLTQKEKDSNDKAWYKHKIQTFDTAHIIHKGWDYRDLSFNLDLRTSGCYKNLKI